MDLDGLVWIVSSCSHRFCLAIGSNLEIGRSYSGGSVFQWAPEKQVGFGYVPNLMRAGVLGDGRSAKICAAFTECYEALNKK